MLAIVGALKEEMVDLQRRMSLEQTFAWWRCRIYRGNYAKRDVLLLQTGTGKERAEIATRFILEHYPVTALISLGFAGALFVLLPRLGGATTNASGNLLSLIAAFCFSMANTYGRKISRDYDTRVLTAGQMLAGGLVLLVLAVVFEHPGLRHVSVQGWIAVLYLAVFGSLLPYLIWTHLLKYHEASRLSLFVFSIPVLASLLSFVIFGERFSSSTLVGLGLIAGGLLLIGRGR